MDCSKKSNGNRIAQELFLCAPSYKNRLSTLAFLTLFALTSAAKANVGSNGTFSYSYPIEIPAGTGGVAPNISLEYNSGSNIDQAGHGWSIAGLPAISVITWDDAVDFENPTSFDYSGPGGKLFDQNDDQSLFLPTDGSFAQYIPNYSDCDSGTQIANPCYWLMHDGNGNTYKFGGGGNSSVQARKQNGATFTYQPKHTWALRKFTNSSGLSYNVKYMQTGGNYYPTEIIYTHGTGISKKRYISFAYIDDSGTAGDSEDFVRNLQRRFMGGMYVENSLRLKQIKVETDCYLVFRCSIRTYELNYEALEGASDLINDYTRLASIKELGSDTSFLQKTTFTYTGISNIKVKWDNETTNVLNWGNFFNTNNGHISSSPDHGYQLLVADYNGDGYDDISWVDYGNFEYVVRFRDKNGWAGEYRNTMYMSGSDLTKFIMYPGGTNIPGSTVKYFQNGDFNGDGFADIVFRDYVNQRLNFLFSKGNGDFDVRAYKPQAFNMSDFSALESFRVADFNGDGLSDVFFNQDQEMHTLISHGDSNFTHNSQSNPNGHYFYDLVDPISLYVGDFNGDSNSDIIVYNTENNKLLIFTTHVSGANRRQISHVKHAHSVPHFPYNDATSGDFNGDGLIDVAIHRGSHLDILYSTGSPETGFFKEETIEQLTSNNGPSGVHRLYSGNLNGDNRSDLFWISPEANIFESYAQFNYILFSGQRRILAQNSFHLYQGAHAYGSLERVMHFKIGDFNGDSRTDWMFLGYNPIYGHYDYIHPDYHNKLVVVTSNNLPDVDQQTHAHIQPKIRKITNGIGGRTFVTYKRLNRDLQNGLYTPGVHNCEAGTTIEQCGLPAVGTYELVTKVKTDTTTGIASETRYLYSNLRRRLGDYTERAWLGPRHFFSYTRQSDNNELRTQTTFYQGTKFTGFPIGTTTNIISDSAPGGDDNALNDNIVAKVSRQTTNPADLIQYACNANWCWESDTDFLTKPKNIRATRTQAIDYEGTTELLTATTDFKYNSYAQVKKATTTKSANGQSKTVIKKTGYINDPFAQTPTVGLVKKKETYHNSETESNLVQRVHYGYDNMGRGLAGNRLLLTNEETQIGDNEFAEVVRDYSALGLLIKTEYPNGAVAEIEYETDYYLYPATTSQSSEGVAYTTTLQEIDPRFDVPLKITTPNGAEVRYEYDEFGRMQASSIYEDGDQIRRVTYHYSMGAPESWVQTCQRHGTDFNGLYCQRKIFDGLGNVLRTVAHDINNEALAPKAIVNEYDSTGRLLRVSKPFFANSMDGDGSPQFWQEFDYDVQGRVTKETKPGFYGRITRYEYNAHLASNGASSVHTTDPTGNITVKRYNLEGNLIVSRQDTSEGNVLVNYNYNGIGQLESVIAPQGTTSIEYYPYNHRQKSVTDPNAGRVDYNYNWTHGMPGFGQLASQEKPHPNLPTGTITTTFQYGAFGRPTREDLDDGSFTEFYYDAYAGAENPLGNLVETYYETSEISVRNVYDYDIIGNITYTQKTVQRGAETLSGIYRSTYDKLDRLRTITYPGDAVYSVDYYSGSARIKTLSLDATQYANYEGYNIDGNPGKVTYGNGVVNDYTYMATTGFLSKIKSQKEATILQDLDYTFLKDGRVDEVNNNVIPALNTRYHFDDLKRLTKATRYTAWQNFQYSYDTAGNLLSKEGQTFDYTPGTTKLASTGGATYSYSASGNLIQKSNKEFIYNHRQQLEEVKEDGDSVVKYHYDYDGTRVLKVHSPSDELDTDYVTFYLGDGFEYRQKYVDDLPAQSQTTLYINGIDGEKIASKTAGANLLAYNQPRIRAASFTASSPGSLEYRLGTPEDRQLGLAQAVIVAFTLLTVLGLAILYFLPPGRGHKDYQPRFKGLRRVAIFLVAGLFSLSFGACGSGTVFDRYFALDVQMALTGDTRHGLPLGEHYYIKDHLGSASVVTDENGDEVQRITYKPYGEIDQQYSGKWNGTAIEDADDAVTHKFTGQEHDPESGLYYYNARYYDPDLGRFLQADTIVPNPESSQDYNRYMYVVGNPIGLTDPSGNSYCNGKSYGPGHNAGCGSSSLSGAARPGASNEVHITVYADENGNVYNWDKNGQMYAGNNPVAFNEKMDGNVGQSSGTPAVSYADPDGYLNDPKFTGYIDKHGNVQPSPGYFVSSGLYDNFAKNWNIKDGQVIADVMLRGYSMEYGRALGGGGKTFAPEGVEGTGSPIGTADSGGADGSASGSPSTSPTGYVPGLGEGLGAGGLSGSSIHGDYSAMSGADSSYGGAQPSQGNPDNALEKAHYASSMTAAIAGRTADLAKSLLDETDKVFNSGRASGAAKLAGKIGFGLSGLGIGFGLLQLGLGVYNGSTKDRLLGGLAIAVAALSIMGFAGAAAVMGLGVITANVVWREE